MFDKVSLYHGELNGEMVPMLTAWNQTDNIATDVNTIELTDEQYEYLLNKKS